MCGITGIISLSGQGINSERIKSMCDAIQHRGPDGAGYFLAKTNIHNSSTQNHFQLFTEKKFSYHPLSLPLIDNSEDKNYLYQQQWNLFFGHRRLAILDLSVSGFQPMSDAAKKVWITYNGEIYNFKEVKQQLIQLGYEFNSDTDTEVIINAYLEWGIEAILLFNGMFAIALWDSRQGKVFLVRDRYGVKPLYYMRTAQNEIIFGSEVKAILAYLPNKSNIDYHALVEYFTFQNLFTDKTLFENIRILPPGNYLEIDLKNSHVHQMQYWDFHFQEDASIRDEKDYIQELQHLFEQAVERQLISDVEIGSYLSGGIDSGSITAVAAQKLPYIKTFTIGFDLNNASGIELGFDERSKAELLSYRYRTEQYEMVLKSGDMERCLPKFAWHLEEPRVGQSYPNYYAAKLASKFVKVVLSGAGGDELFGGYPWRYYRVLNNDNFDDYINKYYEFWQRLLPNDELKQLLSPIWQRVDQVSTHDIFKRVFKHHAVKLNSPKDYVNHSLYFEAKTFLHGLLVVEDKLSMAHSLETRVPFLDNDLVDFAQKIPVHLKLHRLNDVLRIDENAIGDKSSNYYIKNNDGKLILRQALRAYMPQEYLQAAKQGFSAPDQSWFKGDSIDFIKNTFLDRQAKIFNYLDYHAVNLKIQQHLAGAKNNRLLIWSLINFNSWVKTFL